MHNLKGFLALFATGIIFGLFSIYIRFLSDNLTAFQQVFLRNFIACLLAIVIVFLLKQKFSFKGASKLILLGYTFCFPIGVILFVFSVLETKIITAVFGVYLGSLLSSLIVGVLLFKEKVDALKIVVLSLVFGGLIIYVWPISASNLLNLGLLFGIGTGIVDTISNSFRKYLGRKHGGDSIDKFVLVSLQALGGVIISSILILANGQSAVPSIPITSWVILTVFGLSLLGVYYLTLIGFKNFDLNLGTVVISSELFFGPLFATIFFREYPTVFQTIGAIIIMLAIVVLNVNLKAFKKVVEVKT